MAANSVFGGGSTTDIRFQSANSDFFGLAMQGSNGEVSTEAFVAMEMNVAGTASLLGCNIPTNSSTQPFTVTFRNASAGGNQVATVPAPGGVGATGFFQDTSHSDTITAGNLIDVVASGGSFLANTTMSTYQIGYVPGSGLAVNVGQSLTGTVSASSANNYFSLAGFQNTSGGEYQTTESVVECTIEAGGTFSFLQTHVSSNGNTNTMTATSRINAANGNQTISISASSTGFFSDSSHSDTVTAGNTADMLMATGASTVSTAINLMGMLFTGTTSFDVWCGSGSAVSMSPSSANYQSLIGNVEAAIAEATAEAEWPIAQGFSLMRFLVPANGASTTTTTNFRIAGANGNQTVSIAGGATGLLSDSSHTDTVTANETVDVFVSTSGSGALNAEISSIGVTASAPGTNVTLTGVDAAGTPGTLVAEISVALTGVTATGEAGTVVGTSGQGIVSGVDAVGTPGALAVSSSVTLTGVAATGAAFEVSGNNFTVQGVFATAEAGQVFAPDLLVGVFATAEAGQVRAAEQVFLPVYSIMTNTPVAAIGEMDNTTVAVVGTMLASGPNPRGTQVFAQGVFATAATIALWPSRNVSVKLAGVSTVGAANVVAAFETF